MMRLRRWGKVAQSTVDKIGQSTPGKSQSRLGGFSAIQPVILPNDKEIGKVGIRE